jgi:hypothetical protein
MRGIVAIALVGLSACASSGSSAGSGGAEQSVHIAGMNNSRGLRVTTGAAEGPRIDVVPHSIERIWGTLPAVYDSLQIPVTDRNEEEHRIGNQSLRARGRLGGVLLSRYFNCGNSQGGPNAETYQLQISVLTFAKAQAPGATALATTLQATARPVTLSGEAVQCSSTGALESRIRIMVMERARAAG